MNHDFLFTRGQLFGLLACVAVVSIVATALIQRLLGRFFRNPFAKDDRGGGYR